MSSSAVEEKQQEVLFEIFIGNDQATFTRDELLPFPFFESYMTNWHKESNTTIELGSEHELLFGISHLKCLAEFAKKIAFNVLDELNEEDFEQFATCARYLCFQIPAEKRHQAAVALAGASPSPLVTKLLYNSTGVTSLIEPPPDELQEKMFCSYLDDGQESWIIDKLSSEFKSPTADKYLSTLLTEVTNSNWKIDESDFTERYQRCIKSIGGNNIPFTTEKLSQLVRAGKLTFKISTNRKPSSVSSRDVCRDIRDRAFRTILNNEVSSDIHRGFLTSRLWERVLLDQYGYGFVKVIPRFKDADFELFMDILSTLSEEEFELLAKIARDFIVAYKEVPYDQTKIWKTLGNMVWAAVQFC